MVLDFLHKMVSDHSDTSDSDSYDLSADESCTTRCHEEMSVKGGKGGPGTSTSSRINPRCLCICVTVVGMLALCCVSILGLTAAVYH